MDFDEIFAQYYTLYRAEAEVPNNEDDEYTIAMRLANSSIRRWASYDNTYWKELFAISDTEDTITTVVGTLDYDAPGDMKEAGGLIKLVDADGNTQKHIPLVEPQDAQFKGDQGTFAYFTGDPNNGYVLHLNKAPDTAGLSIRFIYYKTPDLITDGNSVPQMNNPEFMINHMLSNRFRASRNPYYSTAKRDAETELGQMKMANDSGTWSNPWKLADNSATVWGDGDSNTWRF